MKKLMINDFKELACQIIFVMNVIILHIIITFYFRYRGIWCCNDYNKDLVKLLFFHDRGPYHIETSPLIYKANPMYWFLYDRDLGHERVKVVKNMIFWQHCVKSNYAKTVCKRREGPACQHSLSVYLQIMHWRTPHNTSTQPN